MGTTYSFEGTIAITPPLNYAEIRTARTVCIKLAKDAGRKNVTAEDVLTTYMPLSLVLDVFDKETDEGILKITQAAALEAPKSQWWLMIGLDDLVRALIKALPGHDWKGIVTAVRDDRLEGYRLTVNALGADGKKPDLNSLAVIHEVAGSAYMHWGNDLSAKNPDHDLISDLV